MKQSLKIKWFKFFCVAGILAACSGFLWADTSIGIVAGQLENTANILTKVMWAACLLVGAGFLIAAVAQYQIHRNNPKLVPLGNPVTYLILGLISMSIPFLHDLLGLDREAEMKQEEKTQIHQYYDATDLDRPSGGN